VVQFYEHDSGLARSVGSFLGEAVRAGEVAIVLSTEGHRRAFVSELEATGVDPEIAALNGTLIWLDAAATMAEFMPGGRIDSDAFRRVIGSVVRQAADTGRPVRAFGEMVALLWEAGDVLAAIELEELWNELGRELQFSLLCGYHSAAVQGGEHAEALQQICSLHSSVLKDPAHGGSEGERSDGVEVSADFAADHDAPRCARHFVADALGTWGHGGTLLDDARLLVTELATNAVVHARSPFSVMARSEGDLVRLSVRDASSHTPTLRAGGPTATSGRGLRLVAALSSSWGVDTSADGKTVWAELCQTD
jgi:anti-sigma regulatory factor (Ser/Thr protein kinase)